MSTTENRVLTAQVLCSADTSEHSLAPYISGQDLLQRPQRKRRCARADRGLPADKELRRLATDYLQQQRQLWPALVEPDLLPAPTEDVIATMVDEFKSGHRTGNVDPSRAKMFLRLCPKIGGNYNRYSCDNSSPTSITDQMANALRKAHEEGRFIPWCYIFCDFSVTGLDSSRQGYSSYKAVLRHPDHVIETTYVDDFTRASRDELEWWRLAAMSKRLRKRMVGASDGFDLSTADWDVKITIYGLLSRLFIKGLREKVRRGMKGAAGRGTCLGKPPIGFTRRILRDEHGNVVVGPDGEPKHILCIDPSSRDFAFLVFQLFTEKKWSRTRIARHFNACKIEGFDGWSTTAITQILLNPAYIGVFIWNQFRSEFDWEEQKTIRVKNPVSEWQIRVDRSKAIVPIETWKAARRRIAATHRAHPLTGKKWSRNQVSATTLFSGTLFCGSCGEELVLNRSSGKYKVMCCKKGCDRRHDCELTTSKSVRIIEACLLQYIFDALLTDEKIDWLVKSANARLEQEARAPKPDNSHARQELLKAQKRVRNLLATIADEDDDQIRRQYHDEVKKLHSRISTLRSELGDRQPESARAMRPLDVESIKRYLADARTLLNQEIPAAAEAIRALTGPIQIRQEAYSTKKRGARWIATFCPDLVRFLARYAGKCHCPDSVTLGLLNARKWIIPAKVEVVVHHVTQYERLADTFRHLHAKGASVRTLAAAHQMPWQQAKEILHFALTGERPAWKGRRRNAAGKKQELPAYRRIATDVAQLRDGKRMSFAEIAEKLEVSQDTVSRSYDYVHRVDVQAAADEGRTPHRGRYSHSGGQPYGRIENLLGETSNVARIATTVGVSESTVRRVKSKIRSART